MQLASTLVKVDVVGRTAITAKFKIVSIKNKVTMARELSDRVEYEDDLLMHRVGDAPTRPSRVPVGVYTRWCVEHFEKQSPERRAVLQKYPPWSYNKMLWAPPTKEDGTKTWHCVSINDVLPGSDDKLSLQIWTNLDDDPYLPGAPSFLPYQVASVDEVVPISERVYYSLRPKRGKTHTVVPLSRAELLKLTRVIQ